MHFCFSSFSHSRVLITTDVWARGIDVQQVSLVINYDLPAYVICLFGFLWVLLTRCTAIVKTTSIVLVVPADSVAKVLPSMYVSISQYP